MGLLDDQLTALKAARATGEKSVAYNGKRVEYRDVAELEMAIASVQAELDAAGNSTPPRSSVAYYGRGF